MKNEQPNQCPQSDITSFLHEPKGFIEPFPRTDEYDKILVKYGTHLKNLSGITKTA